MPLAYIKILEGSDEVDPGYGNEGGVRPPHIGGGPIIIPPLPPGIKPPPGHIWPPRIPPGHVAPPIFIDGTPENPINIPPGTVWPPLNPGDGVQGKVLALVWLVGIGYKWTVLQAPQISTGLPTPEPK